MQQASVLRVVVKVKERQVKVVDLPWPSTTFLRMKVAPRPLPDRWIQIPTKRFVLPAAWGSDMVTAKILPAARNNRED